MKKLIISIMLTCALALNAQAEQLFSDTSIAVLNGSGYKYMSADDSVSTITLEHISVHSWGDLGFFVDRSFNKDPIYNDVYGEVLPNLRLLSFDDSFVKGINLAMGYAFGQMPGVSFNNQLYGLGLEFNVPHMDYFNLIYYRAYMDNKVYSVGRYLNLEANDEHQLVMLYGYTRGRFNIMGHLSIYAPVDSDKDLETQVYFNPQITYNINDDVNPIRVGIEYNYWQHRFGIKDTKNEPAQNVIAGLIKFHF